MNNEINMARAADISAALVAAGFAPLNEEQIECLGDPDRADEAADMLDDFKARLGLDI
jgi:hypothetical protein